MNFSTFGNNLLCLHDSGIVFPPAFCMLLYFDWHGVKSAFAKWWPLSDTFDSYGSQEHFESGNPDKTLLLCNIEGNFIILSKQQSYQNRIDLSLPFTQRTSFCHHYQVFRCKKRWCVKSQLQKWWVLCMCIYVCVSAAETNTGISQASAISTIPAKENIWTHWPRFQLKGKVWSHKARQWVWHKKGKVWVQNVLSSKE